VRSVVATSQAASHEKERRPSIASLGASPSDVERLVREYCDGLRSVYKLADRWGVHRNTVAKHLKSRRIELGRLSLIALKSDERSSFKDWAYLSTPLDQLWAGIRIRQSLCERWRIERINPPIALRHRETGS